MIQKCLYISDNKAVIRNKDLINIADITNDQDYKNLYIDSNYKEDGGKVYIDFGVVLFHFANWSKWDLEPETFRYKLEKMKCYTLDNFKAYIDSCLNNMCFITIADIKLMRLAGESQEFIQKLVEHRQKIYDMRREESKQKELKRQQENKEYTETQNKKALDMIYNVEKAIVNNKNVTNEEITFYKSRYEYNTTSIILHLMKKYKIEVPIKTQGWINKALANIEYNSAYKDYDYNYYNSSSNSKTFRNYLAKLIFAIKENYGTITKVDFKVEDLFIKRK